MEQPRPAGPPARRRVLADAALRATGGLLALVGGLITGVLTVLLVPLRVAHLPPWVADALADARAVRLPASLLVAIGGALFLVWFGRQAVSVRWGALLPTAGWFTMVVLALRASDAGDRLLVPDDWVGALALFSGTLVLVLGAVIGFTAGARGRPPAGDLRHGRPPASAR